MIDAAHQLRCFVERIERLDEEAQGLRDDKRDVLAEAKAYGLDGPTITALVKRRKIAPEKRDEADALLATYEAALGMGGPGLIDGGEIGPLALPAPELPVEGMSKARAELAAWLDGGIG